MAVDKLVDSTQLDADLTSVANAIRTKGGTSAQIAFPAGFVSAIDAIPTGGVSIEDTFDDWQRPSNWPDLDAICPNDFVGALITYQVRDPVYYPYNKIYLKLSGDAPRKVELGTVQGGAFVPFETHNDVGTSFEEYLPTGHGEFIVVRVTMGTLRNVFLSGIDQTKRLQPAVEIYACGYNAGLASNVKLVAYNTQHIQLRNCNFTSMYGMFDSAQSLKKLDFFNCTFSGDARGMFSNCYNLQSLDLRITLQDTEYFSLPNPVNARKVLLDGLEIPDTVTTSLTNTYSGRAAMQIIILPEVKITNCYNAFRDDSALMYADLSRTDLTNAESMTTMFTGCAGLITVKLPSVYTSISFSESPLLSDESLIGIANAIDSSATGQTVTLHADSKAKCLTIMGNNVNGVFVADATGSMSVTDFITNVKGWTVT